MSLEFEKVKLGHKPTEMVARCLVGKGFGVYTTRGYPYGHGHDVVSDLDVIIYEEQSDRENRWTLFTHSDTTRNRSKETSSFYVTPKHLVDILVQISGEYLREVLEYILDYYDELGPIKEEILRRPPLTNLVTSISY
jgi:hypothetical protein